MSWEHDERYSRQMLFRGIGEAGQKKLLASRVAIVGCGATGSALASLLARAGVGTLRIVDRDYVEPSNLQRQTLFDESDAEQSLPKAIAAARRIACFNSQIVVEPQVADLTPDNIEGLLEGVQLILDGTDNFETRYLLNDYAVQAGSPWIYAAAVGSYGVTLNVLPGKSACLACMSGPITLSNIRNGHVEIDSVSGDITLNSVTGQEVRVSSTNGQIVYDGDFGYPGEYRLTSHTGNIEATFPENTSAEIKATSYRGKVQDDAHLQPKKHPSLSVSEGKSFVGTTLNTLNQAAASVWLKTFSGRIHLKKR